MSAEDKLDADVLVLGAGPAGATTATLLARAGHRVRVLEKAHFPRFHVGESLLPSGLGVLARLDIDLGSEGFLRKGGATFWADATAMAFGFDEGLPGSRDHAFQVDRARFDALIADRARRAGAAVLEGVKATAVEITQDCVTVSTTQGSHTARYVIDATGQDRLLGRQRQTLEAYQGLGRAAAFCHLEGIGDEAAAALESNGHVHVFTVETGWVWVIPLGGHRLSVGVVTREPKIAAALLERALTQVPQLAEWAAGARRTEVRFARNFSYRNTAPHGPRYVCIGDAACFLDPIFSSGVALALEGGAVAADLLSPALGTGLEDAEDLMAPLGDHMEVAYQTFARLIQRFYHSRVVENLFLAATDTTPMRAGMVSLLAGDVWRDDNPIQAMLLRARRHTIA